MYFVGFFLFEIAYEAVFIGIQPQTVSHTNKVYGNLT